MLMMPLTVMIMISNDDNNNFINHSNIDGSLDVLVNVILINTIISCFREALSYSQDDMGYFDPKKFVQNYIKVHNHKDKTLLVSLLAFACFSLLFIFFSTSFHLHPDLQHVLIIDHVFYLQLGGTPAKGNEVMIVCGNQNTILHKEDFSVWACVF